MIYECQTENWSVKIEIEFEHGKFSRYLQIFAPNSVMGQRSAPLYDSEEEALQAAKCELTIFVVRYRQQFPGKIPKPILNLCDFEPYQYKLF